MARTRQTARRGGTRAAVERSPLDEACRLGQVEEVRRLLVSTAATSQQPQQQQPADTSSSNSNNGNNQKTPLHWACSQGHVPVAQILKGHCDAKNPATKDDDTRKTDTDEQNMKNSAWIAMLHAKDENGETPLDHAAHYHLFVHPRPDSNSSSFAMMTWLLEEGGLSLSSQAAPARRVLHQACGQGHLFMTQWLLEKAGDATVGSSSDGDSKSLIEILLGPAAPASVAASPNDSSSSWTALHCAAKGGHWDICALLLQHGADFNAKGQPPQHHRRRGAPDTPPTPVKPFDAVTQKFPPDLQTKYGNLASRQEAIGLVEFLQRQNHLYPQLVHAIHVQDTEKVEHLLSKDRTLPNRFTPQNYGMFASNEEEEEDDDNNAKNLAARKSPLIVAVLQGNVELTRRLLQDHGANVNDGGSIYQDAPLLEVTRPAYESNYDNKHKIGQIKTRQLFDLLLEQPDLNVNVSGGGGSYTPLHYATLGGNVRMIRALLQRGADVNQKTDDSNGGCPPIHFACRWIEDEDDEDEESLEVKTTDETKPALPNQATDPAEAKMPAEPASNQDNGNKPIKVVTRKGRMFELLLRNGANTEAREFDNDQTPLQLLAGGIRSPKRQGLGEMEAAQLLLHYGADVDAREGRQPDDDDYDEDVHGEPGHTALNLAICRGHNYDIAQVLVQRGANVQLRGGILMSDGLTNLHSLCFRQGRDRHSGPRRRVWKLVELLLERGVQPTFHDGDRECPPLLEARFGDGRGKTPLQCAYENGDYAMMFLLLAHRANFGQMDGLDVTAASAIRICFEDTLAVASKILFWGEYDTSLSRMWEERPDVFPDVFPDVVSQVWTVPYENLLHLVCKKGGQIGAMECAQRLVARGASLSTKNVDGKTPVQVAQEKGHANMVQWLQDYEHGRISLFSFATEHEITRRLFRLLEEGGSDYDDYFDSVRECVVSGRANVNCRDIYNFDKTPLHIAAELGDYRVTRLLIENGADVEARDDRQSTPLHASAQTSRSICELLLANGAYVSARDELSFTPLHIASRRNMRAITRLLLAKGADILLRDARQVVGHYSGRRWREDQELWGNTFDLVETIDTKPEVAQNFGAGESSEWKHKVLFGETQILSTENESEVTWSESIGKCVKFVTDFQQEKLETTEDFARLNIVDQTETRKAAGEYLLHFFSRHGNLVMAKWVVQCGATFNTQRNDGMTPLAVAAQHGQVEIVKWLVELARQDQNDSPATPKQPVNVALDLPDNWGNTALHHAARRGCLETVKLLLSVQPTSLILSSKNWLLQTPRACAEKNGHASVVEYFDTLAQ